MTGPPPIPMSCADRPTQGGYVVPWANVTLADGTCDYLTPHNSRVERCWREDLCQVGGHLLGDIAVLIGGPNQMARLFFDEPPMCPPCAIYASQGCPMVGGRRERYATHQRLAESRRGQACAIPGCDCGGFTDTDIDAAGHAGEPALPYFAVWAKPEAWQVCAKPVRYHCADRDCGKVHRRLVISGAYLLEMPRRVILVSTPGGGRVWRKLSPADVATLVTRPLYADPHGATP